MRRTLQSLLGLFLIAASVLGAYNVLADTPEVERLATEAACAGAARKPADGPCNAQKTMMERTPLSQTFTFATPKRSVTVRCARSAVLVGDYACELR